MPAIAIEKCDSKDDFSSHKLTQKAFLPKKQIT